MSKSDAMSAISGVHLEEEEALEYKPKGLPATIDESQHLF